MPSGHMVSACLELQDELAPGGGWVREKLFSAAEASAVSEAVAMVMDAAGFAERDVFGVRLALEEAIVNAVRHGHCNDLAQPVQVRYRVTPEQVIAEVEDQGSGFDPTLVPDPTAPENLDRPGGRGLLLMRHYTTWMRYNRRGNCVTLCKANSQP